MSYLLAPYRNTNCSVLLCFSNKQLVTLSTLAYTMCFEDLRILPHLLHVLCVSYFPFAFFFLLLITMNIGSRFNLSIKILHSQHYLWDGSAFISSFIVILGNYSDCSTHIHQMKKHLLSMKSLVMNKIRFNTLTSSVFLNVTNFGNKDF